MTRKELYYLRQERQEYHKRMKEEMDRARADAETQARENSENARHHQEHQYQQRLRKKMSATKRKNAR